MQNQDLAQLKRLAIFAHVVEQGSFSKAAQVLGLSPPRVSEQMALLEQSLGVRLLQRTTRKLTLTQEGEQLSASAAAMVELLDTVKSTVAQDELAGKVRITAVQDFTNKWLMPRLAKCSQRYPGITFDLIVADQLVDLVENKIDLAVRVGRLKDDSLIARPLFSDHPKLFATADYLAKYEQPLTIDSVQEHTWLLLPQMSENAQVTLYNGSRKISFRPKKYHISDSPLTISHMIKLGMGVGIFLPTLIDESDRDILHPVLTDWHYEKLYASLVYPSRKQLPKRTRCVVDFLLSEI